MDYLANLQPEGLRELEVALVVGGYRHDRAGSISHEHVVRYPDRNALAVDRIDGHRAGRDAGLLAVRRGAVDLTDIACRFDVGFDFAATW